MVNFNKGDFHNVSKISRALSYSPIQFSVYQFDESLSLPEKFNKLYHMFIKLADNNQEIIDYLEEFYKNFDENLYKTVEEILQKWFDDGTLALLINQVIGLIGNLELFRPWDDTVIEKIVNEFTERAQNARWFGAIGDGETDDTVALQRCINYMLDKNIGTMELQGTYKISTPLVINRTNTDNRTIIEFRGSCVITKDPCFVGDQLLQIEMGFHDEDCIVFRNITFDGVDQTVNGLDTFSMEIPYFQDGTKLSDGNQSKMCAFYNCNFFNCYRGARLSSLSYSFYSCLFQNNTVGLFGNLAFNNNSFYNCQFRRNGVGCHLQSPNSTLGTVGNSFYGCNFESNYVVGLILYRAGRTGLYGCYFENNAYNYDLAQGRNLVVPVKKCHVYAYGGSYGGDCTISSCFSWDGGGNIQVTFFSDSHIGGFINQIDSRFSFDVLTAKINSDSGTIPTNFKFQPSEYDSELIVGGVKYDVIKGVVMPYKQYNTTTNQFKTEFQKRYTIPYSASTKLKLFSFKINQQLQNAEMNLKLFIKALTPAGNASSEGYVDSTNYIGLKFASQPQKEYNASLVRMNRGFGTAMLGSPIPQKSGSVLSSNSNIVIEFSDDVGTVYLTDTLNANVPQWGTATTAYVYTTASTTGVLKSGEPKISEIITFLE